MAGGTSTLPRLNILSKACFNKLVPPNARFTSAVSLLTAMARLIRLLHVKAGMRAALDNFDRFLGIVALLIGQEHCWK